MIGTIESGCKITHNLGRSFQAAAHGKSRLPGILAEVLADTGRGSVDPNGIDGVLYLEIKDNPAVQNGTGIQQAAILLIQPQGLPLPVAGDIDLKGVPRGGCPGKISRYRQIL